MLSVTIITKNQEVAATRKMSVHCYFENKQVICFLLKKNDTLGSEYKQGVWSKKLFFVNAVASYNTFVR